MVYLKDSSVLADTLVDSQIQSLWLAQKYT